jgi:hypothetical protein
MDNIHCGVKDEDTAGCILVGDGAGNAVTRGSLHASAVAYERIYPRISGRIIAGDRVTIDVRDRG